MLFTFGADRATGALGLAAPPVAFADAGDCMRGKTKRRKNLTKKEGNLNRLRRRGSERYARPVSTPHSPTATDCGKEEKSNCGSRSSRSIGNEEQGDKEEEEEEL